MKQWKRLIYYLVLNILVSICATLGVLYVWDRTHPGMGGNLSLGPVSAGQVANGTQTALARTTSITGTPPTTTATLPSPSLTPPAATEPPISVEQYRVQPNDTLGAIAAAYGVDLEYLMEVNSLTDPNALSVGMVIYIPVTPQPTPTSDEPEPTATRKPSPAGEAEEETPTRQPGRVVINSVIGAGDLETERVFLTHMGEGEISLEGWTLEDEDGNVFTFPQIKLIADGAVNVWTSAGTPTVVDLYWGQDQAVWESGETVTLRDAEGEEQATYNIP